MDHSFGHRDPDARGYFGAYGGRFVPETLVAPIEELSARISRLDGRELSVRAERLLRDYVGRPTPLYEARRLSHALGGARIVLKREDLAHTGAHKINNALGQALLAVRMGKRRIVAETGPASTASPAPRSVRSSVWTATSTWARRTWRARRSMSFACDCSGPRCEVNAGSRTLKDAINEAMRDWVTNVADTLLPARIGARAASVSAHGAGIPVGDRS